MAKKKDDSIQIFDKLKQNTVFYDCGKKLIANPDDKCLIEKPIMMKYFQNCENRGILPRPRFSELIKDNMLIIRQPLNMDEILTL